MAASDDRREGDGPLAANDLSSAGAEPLETDRLAFDEDERLPWLESPDDDEAEDGVDSGKVIGLVLLGLAVLAVIVGGVWWVTHQDTDPALIADGATIEAPGPYKEKPADPGGKTFAGTGDSSFVVSEGQSRAARLGQSSAAPTPTPTPTPSASPKAATSAAPVEMAGVGVQVGAFSSQAGAEAGWGKLVQQYAPLKDLRHRVVEGRADIGTVYRLQAMAGDAAAAQALCRQLKAAGLACQVKG
jgi:hypothetical protein